MYRIIINLLGIKSFLDILREESSHVGVMINAHTLMRTYTQTNGSFPFNDQISFYVETFNNAKRCSLHRHMDRSFR